MAGEAIYRYGRPAATQVDKAIRRYSQSGPWLPHVALPAALRPPPHVALTHIHTCPLPGPATASGRHPVWSDPADAQVKVNVASQSRLRKLRQTEDQKVINGAWG